MPGPVGLESAAAREVATQSSICRDDESEERVSGPVLGHEVVESNRRRTHGSWQTAPFARVLPAELSELCLSSAQTCRTNPGLDAFMRCAGVAINRGGSGHGTDGGAELRASDRGESECGCGRSG